ncbi:monocarboxylate transporter 13 isoform X2 [Syngnathoides biaculeatus]|nr:monocarboxylate transporter 13 isoform X2 [Syngnathoides biaculeatus]XP_061664735.1 monocarboxylate transporter 13 isoform X2 [Syngnathoides biaculeatus]XP_061664736.1 monocarboxylate transporter 13 isoform X2 [Syngnathoides biaculeatus]XP_061664737.1 monocarboxylate transporter 13 isoform X2 [Syngnathoides biaculeatus]XP_061664738.1 monocarboxylate transporter 13 isoform X2 [Syngnathoides biaculeatus]XP_061664739.1 monocarboxylate transporter 13 isoform X2 [Syngnathoides biaculeatus]XP_06
MAAVRPSAERQRGDEAEDPDGGWGWVLVAALFVSTSLVFGLMRGLGVFFVEFVQYFEESAQAISWISSTGLAAQQFFSPLGAALSNAYDTRLVVMAGGCLAGVGFILASQATCLLHLYLTMGLISGLGWGLVFTPMVATVMASFTRRRTFALGLAFSSIGLASFMFNPLFQFLVETYAWRGALLVLGGLSLNIVPCGALIRSRRRTKGPAKEEAQGTSACGGTLRRVASYLELPLLCERPFVTYTIAITFLNVGYFVPYVHLVAHSRDSDFSEYQAAFVVSAAGVADIFGRVASGWFSDLGRFRLIHLLSFWTALTGLFIMLLPVSTLWGSYVGLVAVSLLYGFCAGALTSLAFTVVPIVAGAERVMGALGLVQLIESSAGLLGTPLSGLLRDVTGDYMASFMVSGSFLILSTLTMATLPHYFSRTDPEFPATAENAEAQRLSSETDGTNALAADATD